MNLKAVTSTPRPKRFSISLRWLMVLGYGALVTFSVGAVLFMSVASNFTNTLSLLNTQAVTLINNMERTIRSETDQAERAVRAIAELKNNNQIVVGNLSGQDFRTQQTLLGSILVTSPIVEVLLVYDLEGNRSGIFRQTDGSFYPLAYEKGSKLEFSSMQDAAKAGESKPDPTNQVIWGEPVVLNNTLFHNVGFPLREGEEIIGYAVAAIGQNTMNKVVARLGANNDTTAFILTSNQKVIAHSRKSEIFDTGQNTDLENFPDAALRQLINSTPLKNFQSTGNKNVDVYESSEGFSDSGHIFITRKLAGYSAEPYVFGAYFTKTDIGAEMQRAIKSAFAGLAALALAVLASILFSRVLAKRMHKISNVANAFSNLDLDHYKPLPPSRIREIDEQGRAMNSMHYALSEFSMYVPKTLVKRMMESGGQTTQSVEREITIMFADIAGFTTMSENLNAIETASLLNRHFEMLGHEITKHKGTVDKFIGDGMMAFWGAPDADNDQAKNAINSAFDISTALEKSNALRAKQSLPPMRLRIGIHTGRVVVGNIGSDERHNYTIVGDAVNVANRLEQCGKLHIGDLQSIIMVSNTTWLAAEKPENLHSIGLQKMRGRAGLVQVFTSAQSVEDAQNPSKQSEVG